MNRNTRRCCSRRSTLPSLRRPSSFTIRLFYHAFETRVFIAPFLVVCVGLRVRARIRVRVLVEMGHWLVGRVGESLAGRGIRWLSFQASVPRPLQDIPMVEVSQVLYQMVLSCKTASSAFCITVADSSIAIEYLGSLLLLGSLVLMNASLVAL
jgi:hypothetical protein